MNTKLTMILRVFLGLFMILLGLNKFMGFIEIPAPSGDGGVLMGIYVTSGFLKIIGVLELVAGLSLVVNKYIPLSLTIITAIMFNATVFHALHDPAGIGAAAICLLICLILVYAYKDSFSSLLKA